jgi:uncharacterized protein
MTPALIDKIAIRIGEHAKDHGLRTVTVAFHGGEPLLAGHALLDHAAISLRRHAPGVNVDLRVQTNATLIDSSMAHVLARHNIRVGISLDGNKAHHDRPRPTQSGQGSYDQAIAGLDTLRRHAGHLFDGFLCVVDTANDPIEVYESLVAHRPPAIDFLLPHGTWTDPPPGLSADPSHTLYGDWLATIFDRWYAARPMPTRVRVLEEIMHLALGGSGHTEHLGLSPAAFAIVDTDGSLQQVDSLKSAFNGATATGLHVATDSFNDFLSHPSIALRQEGLASLSSECQRCPLVSVCGGGNYAHRYRAGTGFENPSVYCHDLKRIILHVLARLRADLVVQQ